MEWRANNPRFHPSFISHPLCCIVKIIEAKNLSKTSTGGSPFCNWRCTIQVVARLIKWQGSRSKCNEYLPYVHFWNLSWKMSKKNKTFHYHRFHSTIILITSFDTLLTTVFATRMDSAREVNEHWENNVLNHSITKSNWSKKKITHAIVCLGAQK